MSTSTVVAAPRRPPVVGLLVASAGLALALFGQARADVKVTDWWDWTGLFCIAAALWGIGLLWDRETFPARRLAVEVGPAFTRRRLALLAGAGVTVLVITVLLPALSGPLGGDFSLLKYPDPDSGANSITRLGAVAWLLALGMYLCAVAAPLRAGEWLRDLAGDPLVVRVSRAALVVAGITLVAAVFRLHDLPGVPLEMTSDHTEKLKDVRSIVEGLRPVFMPNNAGREALQFYMTAGLVKLGLPLSFTTLKLGMVLVSIATVPVVYLVGRRVGGQAVGFFAALILALAPWHLQITRIGLRIAFSPFFTAACLGLLFRALATGRRNDWLLAGLVTGLGVYGYTGFRPFVLVLPVVVLARLAYAWKWRALPNGAEVRTLAGHALAAAGAGAIVLVPIARYAFDRPNAFFYRTLTRVTGQEQAIQGSMSHVLVDNWRRALLMMNATSDAAWFQSPAGRPALETVGGALVVLGVVTALYRAGRGDWQSLVVLVSLPVMMASSALSLAFPGENPSLSRAAGAMVPAVLLAALPLPVLERRMRDLAGLAGTAAFLCVAAFLMVVMARHTDQRYFGEYRNQYDNSTHNTTEYAQVIRSFVALGGDLNHAYLVGWANGPDFRAIGDLAGDLNWNGLLWGAAGDGSDAVQQVEILGHPKDPARKLYLVGGGPAITEANLAVLRKVYPNALVTLHHSRVPTRDFYSVLVPGANE